MSDPTWLPDVLRAEGLPVREINGWRDRGHGDFGGIWGIVCHHTGSNNASAESIAFHPSLGLASQLHLSRDGVFTVCGAGVAWHAGQGSWPGIQTNNANQVTLGIEAASAGQSWPAVQYNAYVRGVAAILRKLGQPASHAIGHKEYAAIQGKWDPGGIDMKRFRAQIAAEQTQLKRGVVVRPIPVVNMIELEAKENPWVGARKAKAGAEGETPVGADGKGRMVAYANAHIYFSLTGGAHAIPHADPGKPNTGLFEAYQARGYERGELGYPVRDFSPLSGGAVMAFQGGVLYRKDGQPGFVVKGLIGQRWALEGYEKGDLGWPISDEMPNGTGGVVQLFEHGRLQWDRSSAVKEIGAAATDHTIVNSVGLPLAVDAVTRTV